MNALAIATGGMIAPSLCALLARNARREGLVKPVSAKVIVEECPPVARIRVVPKPLPPPISHQLFPTPSKPIIRASSASTKTNGVARVSVGKKAAAPPGPAAPTQAVPKPTVRVRKNGNGRKRPKLKIKKEDS